MSNNLTDLEAMAVVVKEFRLIGKANRAVLLGMLTKEHELLGDSVEDPYIELRKQYNARGGRHGGKVAGSIADNFIYTIKEVRNVGNIGLKEAKDLVESW